MKKPPAYRQHEPRYLGDPDYRKELPPGWKTVIWVALAVVLASFVFAKGTAALPTQIDSFVPDFTSGSGNLDGRGGGW